MASAREHSGPRGPCGFVEVADVAEPGAHAVPTRAGLVHQLQLVESKRLKIATQIGIRALMAEQPGSRDHLNQFSTFRAGTRLNSETLSVTQTASRARACAAISMSYAPIGVPFLSRDTRIEA